jgi:hypothetical protein
LEDPFDTVDLTPQGLIRRSLPVMVTEAVTPRSLSAAERPGNAVYRVRTAERLAEAERIMVNGFPLPVYQSSPPGRMLPTGLLEMPKVSIFIAKANGTPAGTCMTVRDEHGWGGVYWVTVLPEHRRAGVGGTLMRSALSELAGLPVVLCATTAGAPLYRPDRRPRTP